MLKIEAKGVSNGIAIAKIHVMDRDDEIKAEKTADKSHESKRVKIALAKANEKLEALKSKIDGDESEIFSAHQMMLEDPELINTIDSYIEQDYSAEYSVFKAKEDLKEIFYSMEDEYFRARANDIEDVLMRVIRILEGKEGTELSGEYILLSDELYPSETLEMDFQNIKGIVTIRGSETSHTTILANNLKIPALISVQIGDIEACDNKLGIIDGRDGIFIIDPTDEVIEEYKLKMKEIGKRSQELNKYKDEPAITKSGKRIGIYANIGSDIEAEAAFDNGAEGVGLFRSEFLFLGRKNAPDEEEQFRAYKNAVNYMNGKPVIIRTMDIGADKQVDYLDLDDEDNPQMGLRAIRISLKKPELFKIQLRALLRAAHFGPLKIMLPMIISVDEINKTKALIEECKCELKSSGVEYGKVELGIMIETPAAAITADELGKHVDFFSIGTNDLVSYTLAVDRTNSDIAEYLDSHNEAVKRLIKMTAEAAHKNNIDVGICGALGADISLLDFFLEIGIDELSVPVNRVLDLKEAVINRWLKSIQQLSS